VISNAKTQSGRVSLRLVKGSEENRSEERDIHRLILDMPNDIRTTSHSARWLGSGNSECVQPSV